MRLDQRLVAEGLAPSRARAQAMIKAGAVTVDGTAITKPADTRSGALAVTASDPWVSRAAHKLLQALDTFGLEPAGVALDLGASTGGFTQVLLARGAAEVHAIDVGHGQLAPDIAADPRVHVYEGVNAKALPDTLPVPDWITVDLSFISLAKALPPALALARPGAHLVALIKPQFEAGRAHIGKGGIVKDTNVHDAVCDRVHTFLSEQHWTPLGLIESPILGSDGNREFLIAARKNALSQG